MIRNFLYERPLLVISLVVTLLVSKQLLQASRGLEVLENHVAVVRLTPSSHPYQLVYEDRRVRISIGYDDFVDYVAQSDILEQDPAVRQQATPFLSEWQQEVDIRLREEGTYPLDGHDHRHLIAAMLETGKASVWDKLSGAPVATITVRTYGVHCGPLCGAGYRYFSYHRPSLASLTAPLFFKIHDWSF